MTTASAAPAAPAAPAPAPGECPFCDILNGSAPGKVIARDEERGFALIESIHPESVVHWLAVPVEHVPSTEVMEQAEGSRFLQLFEFAITQVKAQREEIPQLYQGFTIKIHFGSYESVPHAKLHVLATE
jgi:histidine triad (HIT) family protein